VPKQKLDNAWSLTTCERIAALRVTQKEREAKLKDLVEDRKDKLETWKAAEAELAAELDEAETEHGSKEAWPIETAKAITKARVRMKKAESEYDKAAAKVDDARDALKTTTGELAELLDDAIDGSDLFENAVKETVAEVEAEEEAEGGPAPLRLTPDEEEDIDPEGGNTEGLPVSAAAFARGRAKRSALWRNATWPTIFEEIDNEWPAEDVETLYSNLKSRDIHTFYDLTQKLRSTDRGTLSECIHGEATLESVFNEDEGMMEDLVEWMGRMYAAAPDAAIADDLHALAHKMGRTACERMFYGNGDIASIIDDGKERAAARKKAPKKKGSRKKKAAATA